MWDLMHSSDARNNIKMKAMMNTYGIEGYGVFWAMVEMLGPPQVLKDRLDSVALKLGAEAREIESELADIYIIDALKYEFRDTSFDINEFYCSCKENYDLIDNDEIYFWQEIGD